MTQSGSNSPENVAQGGNRPAPMRQTPGIWRPFEGLRGEIDRLFDDFGRDWRVPFGGLPRAFAHGFGDLVHPAVDIQETEQAFELSAELPGMDEKDIELKITGQRLLIRGEKKEEREEKTAESYLSERRFGSFERSFALPDNVDPQKIEARFDNGVLKVTMPKKPEAKSAEQKIEIKKA